MTAREFWCQVYIAAVRAGLPPPLAKESADAAANEYLNRFNNGQPDVRPY